MLTIFSADEEQITWLTVGHEIMGKTVNILKLILYMNFHQRTLSSLLRVINTINVKEILMEDLINFFKSSMSDVNNPQ